MSKQFQLKAPYQPAGGQPLAIKRLTEGIEQGFNRQTLLGVTGSGKTAVMSWVIAKTQKPTLIISHNKTLAAQLAQEFRDFFPNNAVEYFVSYYDYYQPEAYIPRTDTYIAKDSSINDEIDRLRHSSMESILTRQDVIVVASVSCIYGLGAPQNYFGTRLTLKLKQSITRREILRQLTNLQYTRNDLDLVRGAYRVRGDIIDIHPAGKEYILRVESFGPAIERLTYLDNLTGEILDSPKSATIFPAAFFITPSDNLKKSFASIRQELSQQVQHFKKRNKLVEAQRLEQRTIYDLEMMREIGYVSGIENYSRHLDGRRAGEPPATLLDYFNHAFGSNGFLTLIDESHMTIPQISAMHGGNAARKNNLVAFGFRLPSARDNRPLKFSEFEDRVGPTIFISATPADFEQNTSQQTVKLIIRPTGLLDPTTDVRPTKHQVDNVISGIKDRTAKKQRVLVTTLTKRMAEELSTYLVEMGIKCAYIHSDIDTIERLEILRDLRAGHYDALVGINLLREGLDLPEVSLVAILDADKEGYLRSARSLIQTMGRAARHIDGHVIMYADTITGSMRQAIDETNRRRAIQERHNKRRHITPRSITKAIRKYLITSPAPSQVKDIQPEEIPPDEINRVVKELTKKMDLAASNLAFEDAAKLRDAIHNIRQKSKAALL